MRKAKVFMFFCSLLTIFGVLCLIFSLKENRNSPAGVTSLHGQHLNKYTDKFVGVENVRSLQLSSSMWRAARVTCLIITSAGNIVKRAIHVSATWAKDCDIEYYGSGKNSSLLPRILLTKYERYEDLWWKVLDLFDQMPAESSDWFLKSDDDTYVVMSNLRRLLRTLDPNQPYYIGMAMSYKFSDGSQQVYMAGGCGYVLSRGALLLLQNEGLRGSRRCHLRSPTSFEDVNMGECMQLLDVQFADARDSIGRQQFLPYSPHLMLQKNLDGGSHAWVNEKALASIPFGPTALTKEPISFHEIRRPEDFYLLRYLIDIVNVEEIPGL